MASCGLGVAFWRVTTDHERMAVESSLVFIGPAGVVSVPYGARSISLSVKAGSVTVSIAAGPGVIVSAGLSHTWSVDGPDEKLSEAFDFVGDGAADAYVTITRE